MGNLLGGLAIVGLLVIFIGIGIYIVQAIFLNKFNKLVNGKGTALAWIPICNIYLLGKLTINKLVGWILVICVFLTGSYTVTINGVETTHTILPDGISSIFSKLYSIVVLALFIYAIVKYSKLKNNSNTNVDQPQNSQQPVFTQNEVTEQPTEQPVFTPNEVAEQSTEQPVFTPNEVTEQSTEQPVFTPNEVTEQPTEQPTFTPNEVAEQPTEQPVFTPNEVTEQPTEQATESQANQTNQNNML